MLFRGSANVFEANVGIQILDENGDVLVETFTTATCGTGCRGTFRTTVPYEVDHAQQGTIVVHDDDAAGTGTFPHEVRIPSDSCRESLPSEIRHVLSIAQTTGKGAPSGVEANLLTVPVDMATVTRRGEALSSRRYRMTRRGARAVTPVAAFAAAILIGVEAAARAQQAGGQPEQTLGDEVVADGVTVAGVPVGGLDGGRGAQGRAGVGVASRDRRLPQPGLALRAADARSHRRGGGRRQGGRQRFEGNVRRPRRPGGRACPAALDALLRQDLDERTRNAAIVLRGTRPDRGAPASDAS